jgi:hypothetical protein
MLKITKEQVISTIKSLREIEKITKDMSATFSSKIKFTMDGHLMGGVGVCLAAYMFNLNLEETTSKAGYDATTKDGQKVEIKIRKAAPLLTISQSSVDLSKTKEGLNLIVLKISDSFNVKLIFNGLLTEEITSKLDKNNCIPLSKVRNMQQLKPLPQSVSIDTINELIYNSR